MSAQNTLGVVRSAREEALRHCKHGEKPQVSSESNIRPIGPCKPLTLNLGALLKKALR